MTAQLLFITAGVALVLIGIMIPRLISHLTLAKGGASKGVAGLPIARVLSIVLCVLGGYLFVGGIFLVEDVNRHDERVHWEKNEQVAMARASAENRPIFIDFYADWCQACKELDQKMFSREDVASALEQYVLLKADMTDGTDENDQMQARYGVMGLPTMVLLPPPMSLEGEPEAMDRAGAVALDPSAPELENPDKMIDRLNTFVKAGADVDGSQAEQTSMAGRIGEALGGPLWLALLLLFAGGILSSFTPCVYPLIPITLGVMGALGAKSRGQSFRLAFTYVSGLAIMYSILGVFAAGAGKLFGSALQSPVVLGLVAIIFVLMGISMLGGFQIPVPVSLQTKAAGIGGGGKSGSGYVRAVLMGLVAGIVAAPCLGPVLVVLLAYISNVASPVMGFLLMLSYALGLGLLFLVLGTFSGIVASLPKSGPWMDTVKGVFGVAFLVLALWYLKDAFPVLKSVFAIGT